MSFALELGFWDVLRFVIPDAAVIVDSGDYLVTDAGDIIITG